MPNCPHESCARKLRSKTPLEAREEKLRFMAATWPCEMALWQGAPLGGVQKRHWSKRDHCPDSALLYQL